MFSKFGMGSLLAVLMFWCVPAWSAGEVFVVRGVGVDATAAGAAEARDIALTKGQRQAFDTLMRRLTRQQDWSFLPNPPGSQLANLVLGVEVAEERASSTRYIAKVTYAFKPGAIRNLLRSSGIAFSEARAKPSLLLAVLETPEGVLLWEEQNPWRDAWARQGLADELVPILVPLNDLADSTFISNLGALTASWADVSAIASKYGLENVLIAHGRVDGALGESDLKVRLVRLSAARETETEFDFSGGGEAGIQLEKAVAAARNRVYEEWKAATIVVYGQEKALTASIWFDTLADWMIIRRRLEQAPTVTGLDILGFSPEGAEVRVHYVGTEGQLRITLEQTSILMGNGAGFWEIAMAENGLRTTAPVPYEPPTGEAIPSYDPTGTDASAPRLPEGSANAAGVAGAGETLPGEQPASDAGELILAPGVDPELISGSQ